MPTRNENAAFDPQAVKALPLRMTMHAQFYRFLIAETLGQQLSPRRSSNTRNTVSVTRSDCATSC